MLRSDLSSLTGLPPEVVAMDLSQAISDERYGEIAWKYLAQQADYVANGFTALNTAFISNGVFVYIPKGVSVELPIHLLFHLRWWPDGKFPSRAGCCRRKQ